MYNVISVWEEPRVRPSRKVKPLVGLMYTSGSAESSPRPSDDQCLARKVTYYQEQSPAALNPLNIDKQPIIGISKMR